MAALAVGAAGGFISGKNAGSPTTGTTAAEDAARGMRGSARPGAGTDEEAAKRSTKARSVDDIYKTPGNMGRMQGLMEYYSGLSPEQLEDEARKLENLPFNERMMASFILFGRWAEVDPTAAMAFTNTMGFGGAFMKPTILQSWASVDPENAAQYYAQNPREFAMMGMMGGRGGQQPASIIAGEWARQDPDAALAWASTLENGKGEAMTAVVGELAKTDPAKAAVMVASMDADDRQGAYEILARQWGAKNFDEAKAWVNSLPADQRDAAMASAISGLAQGSPLIAANEIKNMTGDAADRAVPTLVQSWSHDDPASAAKWLSENASDQAQRRSMNDLMPNWVSQDPAAALTYVQAQTGEVYDSAAASYIMNDRVSEPSKLLDMASSITDNGDKFRSIGIVTARWMQEDSAAAKQAIQQMDIPDRMKERLTDGGGGWGRGGRGRGR